MASTDRSELYQALKAAGYKFEKLYTQYTTDELKAIFRAELAKQEAKTGIRGAAKDEAELPTQRRADELTPIRTDLNGRIVYQEEIQKSSLAKSRGYRVHREVGTGVKTVTLPADAEGFTETIEVADGSRKPLEVKVGIPTWQVGIYKEPQFPFRTVEYRTAKGFYRQDVEAFFGGPDVLPEGIETMYVGNLIAYPIREVVVAINREFNQLQKKGSVV
jgi:hypothetical protein